MSLYQPADERRTLASYNQVTKNVKRQVAGVKKNC
jgi:hypothetical protein